MRGRNCAPALPREREPAGNGASGHLATGYSGRPAELSRSHRRSPPSEVGDDHHAAAERPPRNAPGKAEAREPRAPARTLQVCSRKVSRRPLVQGLRLLGSLTRIVEVMQLLDGRHPEVGVVLELIEHPMSGRLLGPDAQEVWTGPPMPIVPSRCCHFNSPFVGRLSLTISGARCHDLNDNKIAIHEISAWTRTTKKSVT
jgi:hypothetical protein